jgi:outer membrane receptor protein involved in Fe transport
MRLLAQTTHRFAILVLTGLILPPAGAIAAPQETEATTEEAEEAADQASEDAIYGEEITVTAQKREEALEKVPLSVTVLSGDLMEKQRVDGGFQDLVPLVPGLSVTSDALGVSRITLRGINTGGVASTVGVYLGDTPFGSSSGLANAAILSADFDTFDLERVEVLRGPQGTLYGASSLAGVLKYVPNRPSTAGFEGRLLGSVETVDDGDVGYSLTGLVNVPLGEQVAFRASGFYRFDDGFIDSVGDNPIPSLTDPANNIFDGTLVEEDLNTIDRFGGRFGLLIEPSEVFSINLTAQLQSIENGGDSVVDADPTTLEPLHSGPVQSRYTPEFDDIDYRLYSGTIDWDLGGLTLQSITSYGTLEHELRPDLAIATALTGGPPLSSLLTFLFGNPATLPLSAVLPQTTSTDKLTQELRLISPASETFDWLLGAYYTDEESEIDQAILAIEAGTVTPVPGIPALAEAVLDSTYEELALFGNATWHVSPSFDLSFGARASDNDQVASQVSDGPLAGGPVVFEDSESSESPFTYSLSPRFELAEGASLYARVATGFRPGGPNVLPPGAPPEIPRTYDSDSLTSYELGYKTLSSDGTFSLDVAAYLQDWEDIQLLAVVNNFGINANGGTAETRGLELTATVFPSDGLILSLNGAYTDSELTQDTDPIVGGLDGDPLPYVPEWSFGLNADYQWATGQSSLAYVGGSLGYTGDRTVDFNQRTPTGSIQEVDSYVTLNLRAGLHRGQWSLELYGKNLGNEEGVTALNAAGFLPNGAVGLGLIRPRTIGLSVGTTF